MIANLRSFDSGMSSPCQYQRNIQRRLRTNWILVFGRNQLSGWPLFSFDNPHMYEPKMTKQPTTSDDFSIYMQHSLKCNRLFKIGFCSNKFEFLSL